MIWFTLAERLGKSIEEVQAMTTSTDFVKWRHFFELDYNTPNRTDHYLMQIAAQIERFMQSFSKNPKLIALADFIIRFTATAQEEDASTKTLTLRNRGQDLVVIDDGKPGELIPAYSNPSELDPERIKLATEQANAAWGLRFRVVLENKRRMEMRENPGNAQQPRPGT